MIPGAALESYAYDADDADGDNMPDSWEGAHGLDPAVNDGSLDPDGDAIPNALEWSNGSDPQVKNSIPGALLCETWLDVPGYRVAALTGSPGFLQEPDLRSLATSSETFSLPHDAFGSRLRGYLTAPAAGTYTFWVQGDDETELWLSPTDSKFGKELLVRPTLNASSFDTDISQKSRPVTLAAGQRCYIEILHKDYYGGDFCKIAWTRPGASRAIISGDFLESFAPVAEDRDDDDLPDDWETANGLSPADNGSIDPANGSQGDLDGDGLTNAEELAHGTRADLADTDGDGVSDREEIELLETDALMADAAPFQNVATLPGSSFSASSGEWTAASGKAYQQCVRGSLDFPVHLSSAGIYQLKLAFTPTTDSGASPDYEVVFSADGHAIGRVTATVAEGAPGEVSILSPWLPAGDHTLRVFLDNSHWFRRVTIDSLEILSAQGPDTDGNLTPDWVDARLLRTNSIEAPSESITSPVCLEGKARWYALGTVAGAPVQAAPNDRWFADVPLDAILPTTVHASLENGALPLTREIAWIPVNLLENPA
ncbi:MAG: hypothetical protein KDN05_21505, partial [Verrucomicrobiae bacterium]|nr:hypothetical protein [Verrucomicrobiae bacterium]